MTINDYVITLQACISKYPCAPILSQASNRVYRLVESYRYHTDRVCHRTILNAGYLDGLTKDQLNLIQNILTAKVAHHDQPQFDLPYTDDPTVMPN
ncbi:MAG: hypothetical protein Q7V19_12120 [Bacteroidales bacterium]|nr:hypothetical protein [Bacteroidales bacterium]